MTAVDQARQGVPGRLLGEVRTQHLDRAQLLAEASVHGYVTAFWWSAGIFAVGAVVCGLLLPGRVASPEPVADGAGEPVFAH